MGNNNNDDLRRALVDAGIPDNVIDYVLQIKLVQDYELLSKCLFIFIMIVGFISAFIFYNEIYNHIELESERYARSLNGLLYINTVGASLIIAIFGVIFVTGALTGWLMTLSQRAAVSSFVIRFADTRIPRLFKWINGWQIARLRSETDPALYVRKFECGQIWIFVAAAALLLAISAAVAMCETKAHEVFTPTAYVTSPFFPWEAPASRDWASAISVATGCNHASGRRSDSDNIKYEITFIDGTVASMGTAIPIGVSWPRAAEFIDLKLRAAGATFSPWTWLWNESYHPRCIAALRERFSKKDFELVKSLLRVPEQ